ncbi:MAG: glycosyltransferase family 4 protein [Gammaproteobacteria bacterium]
MSECLRIAIVTDAWHPQVNGVVRTLSTTADYLGRAGHEVLMVTPADFRTLPCPTYPEIRLALWPARGVAQCLAAFAPQAVHIATEGPLGLAARAWCRRQGRGFTTSFHTQFPEYIRLRVPLPLDWSYAWLRRFHGAAERTLVPTPSQRQRLVERGFSRLCLWSRGVDTTVFKPDDAVVYELPRPIQVYMGRVAVEKNIESFLALELPGTKLVIGDGPDLARLRAAWPAVRFLGALFGRELARHVAGGDVFVFPSRTDTFGLVLLEAMACGLPVAAYPVQGPVDVVAHGRSGILDEDLGRAITTALGLDPAACVAHAARYSWTASSATFAGHLHVEGDRRVTP